MSYNPDLPLTLACDASSYGLGAVLSHVTPDGERPIVFASRSLNQAEKNYSQIDKEALGLVWGVNKFNSYLFGRSFTMITDHKPLLSIFNPQKGINATTAARLQRYALFLAGYTYVIQYKNTKAYGNCDSVLRLPLESAENTIDSTDIFYSSQFENLPITAEQIARETRKYIIPCRVYDMVQNGLIITDDDLQPYRNRTNELSLYQGCNMWGNRVVVPAKYRASIMGDILEGHLGLVKMKAMGRCYVWRPYIDNDIENTVNSCTGCNESKKHPLEAPIHPWEFPKKPWSRHHVDFAGPFLGYMYLVIVDAYSKWPIVKIMKRTTTALTIEVLRAVFADHGLCDTIATNGPEFASEEFQEFLRRNGIKGLRSAPYHPRTNGLAERFVQMMKQALNSSKLDNGTVQTKLSRFLMQYRNAPHSTTKECPSVLLMGRKLSTKLDRVKPNLNKTVEKSQEKMVRSSRDRQCQLGQNVMIRDYRAASDHEKWNKGTISAITGPVSYKVEIAPEVEWKRHVDQIFEHKENQPLEPTQPVNLPELIL